MRIAYLVNTFPMTSTTFIRSEMDALEEAGVEVRRYAVRRWSEPLVDPLDRRDQARTHYILTGNAVGLAASLLRELATRPLALAKGVALGLRLALNARGRIATHLGYLLEAVHFAQRARADGIDHVHAHFSTNAAALALLCERMGGPSYSFTAHGPDEFLDAARDSLALKMRHATFVVAISHYCRAELVRLGGSAHARKIHVARCGLRLVDFVDKSSADPAGRTVAEGDRTIVCVGRLCPQKGQTLIPAAAAKLRGEFPDLRIVLIGDGESRGAIEAAIARHDVGEIVELRGWRRSEEVRSTIAGARALLLPSFAEGLPIVLLEALALRRPVVTTTIAGIPELVDAQCGWITPPGDEEALEDALRHVMRADPETLAAMGSVGRARVERNHDVRILATTLRGLFASAIATRRSGAAIVDAPLPSV